MALSRFTDPGALVAMLDELPSDPRAIASIARNQTIHHNLLPHLGVPRDLWPSLPRRRGHRVRVRVGYFQNIRGNAEHVVAFWEQVMREKGVESELLERDPAQWRETVNAYSRRQNALDHHIEHWICEFWDEREQRWRLLDANDEFLLAHSGLEVDFFLSPEYFEYAHEGWLRVRSGECDPDQYREDEQDGRSHARSQLLWDCASLLNHDAAGIDDPDGRDYTFIKRQTYAHTGEAELDALDALAALLADGRLDELADFYYAVPALRIEGAEQDPHSLVYDGSGHHLRPGR